MRVKLDEDLSASVATHVASFGYEVLTVRGQGWSGTRDERLWPQVVAEKIYWITADKGFGDIQLFPPRSHSGILLLRPKKESIDAFNWLITQLMNENRLETLVGALTVVTEGSIRIRWE